MSKRIIGEPTDSELDRIYMKERSRKITVGGVNGVILPLTGGWDEPAIRVEFDNGLVLIKRERASDDYECDGEPTALETYNWESPEPYTSLTGRFWTLEDALAAWEQL